MNCISYEFYKGIYMGDMISASDFPRLIARAQNFVRYYTQNKAIPEDCQETYQMACCAVAEQYQIIEASKALAGKALQASLASGKSGELQSQSVGSWSKTYRSGGDSAQQAVASAQSIQASLVGVVRQYLAGTGLLYRGRGCSRGHVPPRCDGL